MLTRRWALMAVGVLSLAPLIADEPKPVDVPQGKVIELFDGKTLKNWKSPEFGGEGKVTVEDGSLVIGVGEPMTGATWTGEALPVVDYEITYEAQRVAGSDFFGTVTFPVQKASCSLVIGGWGGGVTGLSMLDGSSAIENETMTIGDYQSGQWYKVRIRVTKSKIEAWIDSTQVVDVDYTERKLGIRIEVELSKPFGFATYRTKGMIRKVKIAELKAPPAETKSK